MDICQKRNISVIFKEEDGPAYSDGFVTAGIFHFKKRSIEIYTYGFNPQTTDFILKTFAHEVRHALEEKEMYQNYRNKMSLFFYELEQIQQNWEYELSLKFFDKYYDTHLFYIKTEKEADRWAFELLKRFDIFKEEDRSERVRSDEVLEKTSFWYQEREKFINSLKDFSELKKQQVG